SSFVRARSRPPAGPGGPGGPATPAGPVGPTGPAGPVGPVGPGSPLSFPRQAATATTRTMVAIFDFTSFSFLDAMTQEHRGPVAAGDLLEVGALHVPQVAAAEPAVRRPVTRGVIRGDVRVASRVTPALHVKAAVHAQDFARDERRPLRRQKSDGLRHLPRRPRAPERGPLRHRLL